MSFISDIMSIQYMEFTTYRMRDIFPLIKDKKPINIGKNRPIYSDGIFCYKIFEESEIAQSIVNNISSGFYNIMSPHLCGIIYEGDTPRGTVSHKCKTLHINPEDIYSARHRLIDALKRSGMMVNDFHTKNLGKWGGRVVFLDFEAVEKYNPNTNTKDGQLNRAYNDARKYKSTN